MIQFDGLVHVFPTFGVSPGAFQKASSFQLCVDRRRLVSGVFFFGGGGGAGGVVAYM